MKDWLQRHFIPHETNGHRPHFLHEKNMMQIAGVVLFFELVLFILPTVNFVGFVKTLNLGAVLPGILSTLTNVEREKNNLNELVENPVLTQAAQMKAEDMASKSYFAHTSPEGKTPWYWFRQVGYSYSYAGENLAVNFTDSEDVTAAWMNSPTHKANIVGKSYTEVGTGIAVGTYQGREAIFVAQLYGTPLPKVFAASPTPTPTPVQPKTEPTIEPPVSEPLLTEVNEPETVLGESAPTEVVNPVPVTKSPSFWQKLASTPRQTTNVVLYTILAIVLAAVMLEVMIKFEHQHHDLVANGLVVAALIAMVYLANSRIVEAKLETSFQSSVEIPRTLPL